MADDAVMDIVSVEDGIKRQADHAHKAGAQGTARVVRAMLGLLDSETATGKRMANWQGLSLRDAMPLRVNGGLHNLVLTGEDMRLADVYAGRMTEQSSVDALVRELVEKYDARLLPWLDGPPQTNEAGRSASLMAGLMWLSQKLGAKGLGAKFALFELGSSAGINTMMERYHYDLAGVLTGPDNSPMRIKPEWRGDPPPDAPVDIVSIEGCDQAPIDLTDAEAALRLKSYVWPEAAGRMQRIDAAVQLAGECKPNVVQMDAADYVEQMLQKPAPPGVMRVLFHSIVWQYIPDDRQARITQAMEAAGATTSAASADGMDSADAPLAWLSLETNRETFRHELYLRYWPGGGEPKLLGFAHPHGEWVEWEG